MNRHLISTLLLGFALLTLPVTAAGQEILITQNRLIQDDIPGTTGARISADMMANSPFVIVNFITTGATPLNPGFYGFNNSLENAVEYYDTNYQQILRTLSPGWLRFPAG